MQFLASLMILVLLPCTGFACAVCWGDPQDPMVQAANNAILFMLAVLVILLFLPFGYFFIRLARNAKKLSNNGE